MGLLGKIKKGAKKVGRTVKKGATKTSRVIKGGAKRAGRTVKRGARATGRAVRRGARATARAGRRSGRALKTAGKKVGKGASSIGEGAFSVAKEGINRGIGLPEAGLNALGVLPTKKLRLRVVVLANASGQSVVPPNGSQTTKDRVVEAIDVAKKIFKKKARIKIVGAGGKLIQIDKKPAIKEALKVHCDAKALKEDLGKAGFYFRKRMARNAVGTIIGAAEPITAFIVDDVVKKAGCSLGPLTNYVTVDRNGIINGDKRTLAHELGHALGLTHAEGAGSIISGNSSNNLMSSNSGGDGLNKRQIVMMRNSRHVTFL